MKLFKHFALATVLVASFATSALAAEGDSLTVAANHTEPKPDDPVKVKFDKIKVVKATFDPKKIEGGTATLEVDTTSLASGSDKRDAHLKTADFIDSSKFGTITIDIAKVKKAKADKAYTAEATIKFRDVTKKYPVTFTVVDAKDDWVKISGDAKISRFDFNVGGKDLKTTPVKPELAVTLAVTLKKT